MGSMIDPGLNIIAVHFLFAVTHCNHGYETLLSGPRFHFSGSFLCDQATVNNKINNFDVTRFVPHHALPETEGGTGGNSPRGTNSFSLADVTVKSVCYSNQTCNKHKQDDEIIGNEIKGIIFIAFCHSPHGLSFFAGCLPVYLFNKNLFFYLE